MQETFREGYECVKRVQCSCDINFFPPSLNFPPMISFLTLPPFFHVPAPTQKFPGVILTGRGALGLQGGLGACSPAGGEGHGAMIGRAGQNRRVGVLGSRSTINSGGSDGEVIDMCYRS